MSNNGDELIRIRELQPRKRRRPACTHENYIKSCATLLLKETPERQEEMLATLTDKDWPGWRKEMEDEMDRQRQLKD